MRKIIITRWSDLTDQALTEGAVRSRCPSPKYRLGVYHYPPHTKVSGSARAGSCYILRGAVRFMFDHEITLRAGEVADLPDGAFSLEVVGDDRLEYIQCWELSTQGVRDS